MAKYALLKNGVFANVVNADESWTPPDGYTKAVFDPAIHVTTPSVPTSLWISSYRFLFQLHTVPQKIFLDALKKAAEDLSPAQIIDMTPGAVDANGFGLDGLRIVRLAYQQMQELNSRVDLLSTDIDIFFAGVASLGLYGEDSPTIAAEIARIKSNTLPE